MIDPEDLQNKLEDHEERIRLLESNINSLECRSGPKIEVQEWKIPEKPSGEIAVEAHSQAVEDDMAEPTREMTLEEYAKESANILARIPDPAAGMAEAFASNVSDALIEKITNEGDPDYRVILKHIQDSWMTTDRVLPADHFFDAIEHCLECAGEHAIIAMLRRLELQIGAELHQHTIEYERAILTANDMADSYEAEPDREHPLTVGEFWRCCAHGLRVLEDSPELIGITSEHLKAPMKRGISASLFLFHMRSLCFTLSEWYGCFREPQKERNPGGVTGDEPYSIAGGK
jgi:hypothetical protein